MSFPLEKLLVLEVLVLLFWADSSSDDYVLDLSFLSY